MKVSELSTLWKVIDRQAEDPELSVTYPVRGLIAGAGGRALIIFPWTVAPRAPENSAHGGPGYRA